MRIESSPVSYGKKMVIEMKNSLLNLERDHEVMKLQKFDGITAFSTAQIIEMPENKKPSITIPHEDNLSEFERARRTNKTWSMGQDWQSGSSRKSLVLNRKGALDHGSLILSDQRIHKLYSFPARDGKRKQLLPLNHLIFLCPAQPVNERKSTQLGAKASTLRRAKSFSFTQEFSKPQS